MNTFLGVSYIRQEALFVAAYITASEEKLGRKNSRPVEKMKTVALLTFIDSFLTMNKSLPMVLYFRFGTLYKHHCMFEGNCF